MARKVTTSVFASVLLLGGVVTVASAGEHGEQRASSFEKDRQAILDMAGQYDVSFRFRETVSIKDGYELREPFEAGATELIKVVEDTGERIVLQHLLLVGEKGDRGVVKHWRQTWQYEPDVIYAYRGDRTWKPIEISEKKAAGKWRETVFQVDDSPRYAGLGEWRHAQNLSAWQSGETWRPLPRRERKQRDDYDVLVGRNRYTQTPSGWVHEQDNYKLVLEDGEPKQVLAREVGLNRYERTESVNFSPVRDYWQRTAPFWADVRAAWSEVYAKGEPIRLRDKVDGKTSWEHLFERAEQIDSRSSYDREAARAFIDKTIEAFVMDEG